MRQNPNHSVEEAPMKASVLKLTALLLPALALTVAVHAAPARAQVTAPSGGDY